MNKLLILCILTFQTAAHILAVRFTRSVQGPLYLSSSVVTICELSKLLASVAIIFYQSGFNILACWQTISKDCFSDRKDFMKMMVPGLLYTLQNNLLYVGLSNLPAATYQVLYQLKLLTTAIFSVVMLKKELSALQWASLFVLFMGVIMVESAGAEEKIINNSNQNPLIGIFTVLISSLSSGFAGVWFERVIKGGKTKSIWCANVQLATFGIILGLLAGFKNDSDVIVNSGFFYGFSPWVWLVVFLQSFGGLMVSVVVKYADNILKGFACAAAIIVACMGSFFLFTFQMNIQFLIGTGFVIGAIVLYSLPSSKPKEK